MTDGDSLFRIKKKTPQTNKQANRKTSKASRIMGDAQRMDKSAKPKKTCIGAWV